MPKRKDNIMNSVKNLIEYNINSLNNNKLFKRSLKIIKQIKIYIYLFYHTIKTTWGGGGTVYAQDLKSCELKALEGSNPSRPTCF